MLRSANVAERPQPTGASSRAVVAERDPWIVDDNRNGHDASSVVISETN